MKRDFIVRRSITMIEGKPLVETYSEQELVRCKDCKHRGNSEKCVLAAVSKEKDYPLFMLDNRGEWFCADGVKRDE